MKHSKDLSASRKVKESALIFGCGYLGIRVATRLRSQGWNVSAITRSRQRAESLEAQGINAVVADWTKAHTLRNLPTASRVLIAVGFDRSAHQSQYHVYVHGLRNALAKIAEDSNIVYVSSTGVYHHCDGSWVDETSPCKPKPGSGGWCHLKAEETLRSQRPRSPWTILRMAGLYGPGRVPRARDIVAGKSLSVQTKGYLNLIHIDDAAEAVLAAWNSASTPRTFAISDCKPVLRQTYYEHIAQVLRIPCPEFLPPPASASANRRATTNKRVWSAKMQRELGFSIQFADYRAGLAQILEPSFN